MRPVHGTDNPTTFLCRLSRNFGILSLLDLSGLVQVSTRIALHLSQQNIQIILILASTSLQIAKGKCIFLDWGEGGGV
jgi:hypothetical protein